MAEILYMDDPNKITSALFFSPSQQMMNYVTNSVQNYVGAVKGVIPEFASHIQKRYDEIMSSSSIQYIKNLKNRLNSLWETDCIRFLPTIEKIQQAPPSMYRYILAQPDLRRLYQNNGLSAYDNKYVDNYPNTINKTHFDYRRVTEGMIMDIDGEVGYTHYYENVADYDILDIIQKTSILGTWDIIQHNLENDEENYDPTSVWNATL